jgi:hypothetical protein
MNTTLPSSLHLRGHTVVGSAAHAHSFVPLHAAAIGGNGSMIAVLSVRPDGTRMNLLSVLCVMHTLVASPVVAALKGFVDHEHPSELHATVAVRAAVSPRVELACTWLGTDAMVKSTLFRLKCSSDGWNATMAMSSRLRMTLSMTTPALTSLVDFTSEAVGRLPSGVGASICVDSLYLDGVPSDEFSEWALVQQLVGIDCIYVDDQLAYRHLLATPAGSRAGGPVVPTHDIPVRYVVPKGRLYQPRPPNTFKRANDAGVDFFCLHEHWYDKWIGIGWSADEFLTFEQSMKTPCQVLSSLCICIPLRHLHVCRLHGGYTTFPSLSHV